MPDNFEFGDFPPSVLDGTLTARMIDMDDHESNVLDVGLNNGIRVKWTYDGSARGLITGTWHLEAAFERMGGPGGEFNLTGYTKRYEPGKAWEWFKINIPADTVTMPGAYKVVILLSLYDSADNPTFINGFVEIPMVQFRLHT